MPHFLSTQDLTQDQLWRLLNAAEVWLSADHKLRVAAPLLQGRTIAPLFFENSTRTRSSFILAAQRLYAQILPFEVETSAVQKGESVLDTVWNLIAMGVDLFVIRHAISGLPEQIVAQLGDAAIIVNAGDGTNEHPTQALLDLLTIHRHAPAFERLSVAFIGDVKHSRVARSLSFALATMGVNDIRYVAPQYFLPESTLLPQISLYSEPEEGLQEVDVVIALRLQHERMAEAMIAHQAYFQQYGLTAARLRYAKPGAIVMHPGPMNREIEIASEVADGAQSVILKQPTYGVAMRMSIMHALFTGTL